MPAYKDEKQKTWYCQFYYEDWQGNKKKKKKRGFKTKKEAQEWENNFKLSANADMDMKLSSFVEIYLEDKKVELKQRTLRNKRYMIETHINLHSAAFQLAAQIVMKDLKLLSCDVK